MNCDETISCLGLKVGLYCNVVDILLKPEMGK